MTQRVARLQDALAAEHAAVYGYQALGPRLTGSAARTAQVAEEAHRTRRDALTVALSAQHARPTPAAPAYTLPARITDRASALRLAVLLEERTGQVWGAGLPDLHGVERTRALDAVTDCAVRAVAWRRAANVTPLTVPFPGRP